MSWDQLRDTPAWLRQASIHNIESFRRQQRIREAAEAKRRVLKLVSVGLLAAFFLGLLLLLFPFALWS